MNTINFRLLAFASASEALGSTEMDYQLQAKGDHLPTVGDLEQDLKTKYPQVEALWERLAISVNGTIATSTDPVGEGVEVALLPPVSGG